MTRLEAAAFVTLAHVLDAATLLGRLCSMDDLVAHRAAGYTR